MKDLFEYLQLLWEQAGYPGVAGVLAAFAAVTSLFGKLGAMAWKSHQQHKLQRDLHPFYTSQEIQRATQYYVETQCQNIAPSKEDEPGQTHAFATKQKSIPFFLKQAFKQNKDECQFYILLADSGMGKTTFMINLYLRYLHQFRGAKYQIKLFPLGFPDIDKKIEAIKENRGNTILLLDAFDEDPQALHQYKPRLNKLIQKTLDFREVVITCRTQFFPTEEEEPKETGVMRFGGDGGERVFRKLYLAPFDDKDIRTYLKKRFTWYQRDKKHKAWQIVRHSPNLMVRPMLLSYVDDLLESDRPYTAPYMVYVELIQKWVEREAQKMPSERKKHYEEELFTFSREIARDIYTNRKQRQGTLMIPGKEVQSFADKHTIKLSEMEMKGRSLLNRNARGEYKFSHKSVLEYFLAEEAFFNPDFRKILNFESMDVAENFLDDMIVERLTVPFFSRSDVGGEYRLKGGKPRFLTPLNRDLLSQTTHLTLDTWTGDEDVLFFKGLPMLKVLEISAPLSMEQQHTFHQILPTCQITYYITEDEIQDAYGLAAQKITIDAKEYNVLRPVEYITNQYENQSGVVVDHTTGFDVAAIGPRRTI